MKSFFGVYRVPGQSEQESTVLVFDNNLSIGFRQGDDSNTMISWLIRDVETQFELGRQQTRIINKKYAGTELVIEGKEADLFIRGLQAEKKKPWHRKSSGREWIRNSFLLVGILAFLFLVYLLIVPWLSAKLASKVSIKTEEGLGDAVYDAMNLSGQEDTTASYVLNEFFNELNIPSPYRIRITVINENVVNAFALPGGRIVVYKALLNQIESYPELAAVLSHEFTHINNKHTTKSIFRRLGSKVFLGLLFGRLGNVTAVLVDHADNIKSLKYSRSLEKEADREGLLLLHQRKIDPEGFVQLFEHLKTSATGSVLPEFLASHPDLTKRIEYVREAGKGATIENNERLKMIFDKLKNNQP